MRHDCVCDGLLQAVPKRSLGVRDLRELISETGSGTGQHQSGPSRCLTVPGAPPPGRPHRAARCPLEREKAPELVAPRPWCFPIRPPLYRQANRMSALPMVAHPCDTARGLTRRIAHIHSLGALAAKRPGGRARRRRGACRFVPLSAAAGGPGLVICAITGRATTPALVKRVAAHG